jgi:diketogulonate reductase-like aldo/keto reductase
MEKVYKAGKTRSIGVSNYKIEHLEALLKYAEIKPMVNQIEIHPFLPNTELIEYCRSHDIMPAAYSPLGSQEEVPATKEKLLENVALNTLAKKKRTTLAQVLIAWGIKRGYVVLPKSANEERVKRNASLIDLSEEDFEEVNKVAEGRHDRFVNPIGMFGFDAWPEETK